MTSQEAGAIPLPTHRLALRTAFLILERPDIAARFGDMGGRLSNVFGSNGMRSVIKDGLHGLWRERRRSGLFQWSASGRLLLNLGS